MPNLLHLQTIKELLQFGSALLQKNEASHLEAELLLCHVLQVTRSYLYSHGNEKVLFDQIQQYNKLLQVLNEGMPMAYLLGIKEFWSLEFIVNQHTLIPRPETELLVEKALTLLPEKEKLVVDLGVGSGAVAIVLALERPHWQVVGTDISLEALKVAEQNLIKHGVSNVFLMKTNWCYGLPKNIFDAVISNPPYIASSDSHLKQLRHEPLHALTPGKDGLTAIRKIILEAGTCLKKKGWLLLEHGYDQGAAVRNLLLSAGYTSIQTAFDLSGIPRVTSGQWH